MRCPHKMITLGAGVETERVERSCPATLLTQIYL